VKGFRLVSEIKRDRERQIDRREFRRTAERVTLSLVR
jgi:hypothetical protein